MNYNRVYIAKPFLPRRLAILCCFLVLSLEPMISHGATNVDSAVVAVHPRGTWVWSKASWLEPADREALFTFLKQHGLSVILLQIQTDFSGDKPVLQNTQQLSALLREAARDGITVHALDGKSEYIYPPWPERLAGQIQAIAEFNSSQPPNARFVGVHYDIEPHTLPEWKKDWDSRLVVCQYYLKALQTLAKSAHAHNLEFSVDIAFWFGTSDKLKPFEMDGQTGTLLDHIAHTVDWFGIMSYRTKASGPNGILAVAEENISVMEKLGKKAWIGVNTKQTNPKTPAETTFWSQPPAVLDQQLKDVETQMASRKGYGGLLIHSYEWYRDYLKKAPEVSQPSLP